MAQLIVRNLDPALVQELKKRAAANGRSAEEEHREILRVVLGGPSLSSALLKIPDVGNDGDFERPEEPERDVEL